MVSATIPTRHHARGSILIETTIALLTLALILSAILVTMAVQVRSVGRAARDTRVAALLTGELECLYAQGIAPTPHSDAPFTPQLGVPPGLAHVTFTRTLTPREGDWALVTLKARVAGTDRADAPLVVQGMVPLRQRKE